MNHISEFKTYLGNSVETMSEQDVTDYYNLTDQITDIFFDMWVEEISDKNRGDFQEN
ncbi:hypothetical protein KKA66_02075 [Patescibacteria group bacterium]|nr:hypothetical protein [Patescibacteria group bacterium]